MSTNILSSPFQRTVSAAGTYTITRVQDLNHTHGPVSGVANVSAGSQLTITVQPADQTINAGQTAMTSVTATGATSYQWFFFGTDQAFHPIPGATSSTLAYAPAETTKVMVRVSNATCSVDSAVANIFVRPATPLNVGATATSTTAVAVAWSAVPNAVSYEILRSSGGGPFAVTGGAMGTTFGQSGLTAGVTYLYRVRAVDGYGTKSLDSAMDAATTIIFGEDPLVAGVTPIRAQHILELRTAANAFRAAAGLGSASFGAIVVGTTPIRASDINELRSAFAAARAALSMPALVLTDPTLVPGATVVRRLHVEELRAGVK
jgi:hypothetical protein